MQLIMKTILWYLKNAHSFKDSR